MRPSYYALAWKTTQKHRVLTPGSLSCIPQADGSTRLLLRSNMAMKPELPIKLTYFAQFIMERKMLLTLRNRAEQGVTRN